MELFQGYNSGGGSSCVVVLSSSFALEEEIIEVPSGVSGSDETIGLVTVELGKRKVVKGERKVLTNIHFVIWQVVSLVEIGDLPGF